MTLVAALRGARSEEDVKDAYIRSLGLRKYSKGLIDIRTDEIWFEAKEPTTPVTLMFAQLLCYVRDARKHGEPIPPFLAVIDREKAALMETEKALPILADRSIKWPRSGSAVSKSTAAQMAPYIETHFVVYRLDSHEAEFISAAKHAIRAGKFVRTLITPDNLRQVFDRWVELIGRELDGVEEPDYALLFFADIMHDGNKSAIANLPARLLHEDERPVFLLNGRTYELASDGGYRSFWAIYHRPPDEGHRAYLLERRDSLLPLDERSFKGAYYTPLHIVDKAYDFLATALGKNWQQKYTVWDMCCGVGNLEVKHSDHRNVYMSTLDQADIDVMRASRTCVAAHKFQYDYLNDDVKDDGTIDYSLTNKVPESLRQAITDLRSGGQGARPVLVLMNPPYAEAANSLGSKGKTGVATSAIGQTMDSLGFASRELFVQFLTRIKRELPGATVALFSTLKYINAPNFEKFRSQWRAKYLSGFVVHSRAFDGVDGDFPIGFLVWDTSVDQAISTVSTEALDASGQSLGRKKFTSVPNSRLLSRWLPRLPTTQVNVPLKNAISPQTGLAKVSSWHAESIGYMLANANDLQHASTLTAIFSSVCSQGNGFYVTRENVGRIGTVFSVRRLVKPTWLNDRDQFLQPSAPVPPDFETDCVVWMLFSGSNLTAGARGLEWKGESWSLINHFIPYSEAEVGASDRFESDFMWSWLRQRELSQQSADVLEAGRRIWSRFHATRFDRGIREQFKLNEPGAGWYQIRSALLSDKNADRTDFDFLRAAYDELGSKLRPKVYDLGFLLA